MSELAALGLTADQQRVYEILATTTQREVSQLAVAADLPESEVAVALQHLMRIGLAVADPGDRTSFSATPVQLAVDGLVQVRRDALDQAQAYGRDLAQRAMRTAAEGRPEQLVSIVVGSEAMAVLAQQVQRSAREEVLTFDRPPYYLPASMAGSGVDEEQQARMQAGVRYRSVFEESLLDDEAVVARIRRDALVGEEGRLFAGLPLKLLVVDRSSALLPLLTESEREQPACLLIQPSVLLDSLVAMFEAIWRIASPLRFNADDEVGDEEEKVLRQVVRLLAAGVSDARIAHTLGVSERTVRRKVAVAMDRFGAQSRFQAGVRAQEQGWLS